MIADYAQLINEVVERTGISDIANRASTFVGMAEKMLSRRLRLVGMETVSSIRTDPHGVASLPQDYREMRSVRVGNTLLTRRSLPQFHEYPASAYAIQGDSLFSHAKDAEHVCTYFAQVPSLERHRTTWLLDAEPEIYLHAVLFQVFTAYDQVEKARMTSGYLMTLIDDANRADHLNRRANMFIRTGDAPS